MFGKRFTAYQQLEHSDCGLACIRMLVRYYGRKIPYSYLRDMADMNRTGLTIEEIMRLGREIGMNGAAVKISLSDARRMPLPAILYWNQSHYVVLHAIKGDTYYIADPAIGKVRLTEPEFIEKWYCGSDCGIAILLEPEDSFYTHTYPEEKHSGLVKLLTDTLRRHHNTFMIVIFLLLLCSAADIATPYIFQHTVDEGISGKDLDLVWMLVFSQLMVFIGNYMGNGLAEIIITRLGFKAGIKMLEDYLVKMASLPMDFFERKVNSDLIQKIEDQGRIRSFLISMPQNMLLTLLNIVIFSVLLFLFSPIIFVLVISMAVVNILWTHLFSQRRKELDYALTPKLAENRINLYELVNGMAEIKANNAVKSRMRKWYEAQNKINTIGFKALLQNMYISGGNTFLSRLRDIIITGLCAAMVIDGQMTIGVMMTVSFIAGRLTSPLSSLSSFWLNWQDAEMSHKRLAEILTHPEKPKGDRTIPHEGNIILKNVCFKYPGAGSPMVIDDLNMTIVRGKTTAIVGPSGCGKTTLLKLLMKFYSPLSGKIYVGNKDLKDIDEDAWLSHFGTVMQSGYIFSGTIAENIAVEATEVDKRRIEEVCRLSRLSEFIETLPLGINTKIGETGLTLSGGQQQRLLIARALYRQPDFLLLDEATSSLDASNESSIVKQLNEVGKEKTVVIVAHRLSTVKDADYIYYMKAGRVVEYGSHAELIIQRGHYFKLIQDQLEIGK